MPTIRPFKNKRVCLRCGSIRAPREGEDLRNHSLITDKVFVALLLSGFLLRLTMVWAGLCDRYVVADDAYYYYTIARNAAAGLGLSFDSINLTNGFHPLYQILLVPVALAAGIVSSDPWVLIHLALTLCSLFDLLSGIVLGMLMIPFFHRRIVLWGTAAWMLGPWSVLLTLRGLEGSVNVLLLALWLLLVLRHISDFSSQRRISILLGVLYGLAILARTDNLLYVGAGLIVQSVVVMRGRRHEMGAALLNGAYGMLAAVVIALPWAIWNLVHFQTIVQTSALVKMENVRIYGTLVDSRYSALTGLLKQVSAWIWVPVRYIAGEEFGPRRYTWVLIGLGCAATITPLIQARRCRSSTPDVAERALVAGIGTYLLCHVILCTLIVRTYATWYASFPVFLFSAIAGIALGSIPAHRTRSVSLLCLALAVLFVVFTYVHFFLRTGIESRGSEVNKVAGLHLIAQRSPGPHVIGAFNAGSLGYFAPLHGPFRVVNLDGLVNNQVEPECEEGRFEQYIVQTTDVLWLANLAELDIWLNPEQKETILRRFQRLSDNKAGTDAILLRQ